jgi:GNAT superfamily N-acetyltransferase
MFADDVVGTAGVIPDPGGAGGELVSMWVAPPWRGKGVGARLIEEVAGWAALVGLHELRLWVVEGNHFAERSYARAGFARTGQQQPVRPGEPALEFAMARRL